MQLTPRGRTTVPRWVRDLSGPELHALAGRLRREFMEGDISERQDWLLDRCFAELDYRARRPERYDRCNCPLCVPPLEWGDWDQLELDLDPREPF